MRQESTLVKSSVSAIRLAGFKSYKNKFTIHKYFPTYCLTLHVLFPLFWTLFLQIVSDLAFSPPSGLCSNVTFPSGFKQILNVPSPLGIPYSLPMTYFSSMALTIWLTAHFMYRMWALWEPGTLLFSLLYSQVLAQCLQYSSCLVNTQRNIMYFILSTTLRSRSHYYQFCKWNNWVSKSSGGQAKHLRGQSKLSSYCLTIYSPETHFRNTVMSESSHSGRSTYAQPCALTPALASSWHPAHLPLRRQKVKFPGTQRIWWSLQA